MTDHNAAKNRVDPGDLLVRLNAVQYYKPFALVQLTQGEVLACVEEIIASRKVVEAARAFMRNYWDDEQTGTQLQAALDDYYEV
jgi:hypothetical protein